MLYSIFPFFISNKRMDDFDFGDGFENISSFGALDTTTTGSESSELNFITIVLAIIISWILVALWTRTTENLFFVHLGFDGESFWQSLLVTIAVTVIFFVFIFFYNRISNRNQAEVDVFGTPLGTGEENPIQFEPLL